MSRYKCMRCGKVFSELPKPLACTCGSRLFLKMRPEGLVRVVFDPVYCRRCGSYRQGPHPHWFEFFKPIGGVETKGVS